MVGVGVNEGDLEAEEPPPGTFVDQLGAVGGELVERDADVLHLVRDVVHPGAAAGEELADRCFLAEGGEQLDAIGADLQRRRLDALLGNRLATLQLGAEEPFVGGQGRVEIVDGDAKVMNPTRLHAADATGAACGAAVRTRGLSPGVRLN